MMDLYFHGKHVKATDKVYLAMVVTEEGRPIMDKVVNIPGKGKHNWNIFDIMLLGWRMSLKECIEHVEEFEGETIKFKNQNEYLFTWLTENKIPVEREEQYKPILERLGELAQEGVGLEFEVIAGTKNKAKAHLTKYLKETGEDIKLSGELNSLLERYGVVAKENNIVHLDSKRKKA